MKGMAAIVDDDKDYSDDGDVGCALHSFQSRFSIQRLGGWSLTGSVHY